VPLVAVDRHLPQTRADFSGTDDEAGGRMAAEHLLALGHRRLAHVGGEPWVSTYADRRKGFEQAAATRAESVETVGCSQCDCTGAVGTLLAGRARPTAIFAASDLMVPGIYAAAEAVGIAVGRDLAVVGFADLSETRTLVPGLTSLRQNPYEIGRQAARLVMDRIEGTAADDRLQSVRLVPELVVRESSCFLRA
jgi:LacI family transcriptional regulator